MEPRIRLDWSPRSSRPWCPGASLPCGASAESLPAATGFLRVQGLLERLRHRRTATRSRPTADVHPPAPLPKAPGVRFDAAATEASAREPLR